jgi:hypothetical protein
MRYTSRDRNLGEDINVMYKLHISNAWTLTGCHETQNEGEGIEKGSIYARRVQ